MRQVSPYHLWSPKEVKNSHGKIVGVFLSTKIISQGSKIYIKLFSLSTNRILISINGKLAYDSKNSPHGYYKEFLEDEIVLEGGKKENILNVVLLSNTRGKFANHLGFSLLSQNPDLLVRIPLHPNLSEVFRNSLEKEVEGISLKKKIFTIGEPVSVNSEVQTSFEIQVVGEKGLIFRKKLKKIYGEQTLSGTENLDAGNYLLRCIWWNEGANLPITTKEFSFYKVPKTVSGESLSLNDRKDYILKTFLSYDLPKNRRDRIWNQVVRFYSGKEISEEEIISACDHVNKRKDCSDFILQGILRLLFMDKEKKQLNKHLRSFMKDCILNFKYWVDEPGEDHMYMDTENHRLLFHTAEWLAGLLFPEEVFSNSQQRGTFHYLKGKESILKWLELRGKFGFDEWHSNVYFPIVLSALLNIYDFAPPEEYELWLKTKQLLDILMVIFYQDSFEGIFGTTHGRTYENHILYPELNEVSTINWLLSGKGFISSFEGGIGIISLCTSKYLENIPSEVFHYLNTLEEIESKYRQGRLTDQSLSANFSVYKTRYYMVSALTHFYNGPYLSFIKRGKTLKTGALSYWSFPFPHISFAQITLPRNVVIAWSCPLAEVEGFYYWLNMVLPKIFHHKNLLILMFKDVPWITHCSFDREKFDEVVEEKKWVFGRIGKSYVGIFSYNGISFANSGLFRDKELICPSRENIWIAILGNENDFNSFTNFVEKVKKEFFLRCLNEYNDYECYIPNFGTVRFGWNMDYLTINNEKIKQSDYPLFDTPCMYSNFGSGCVKLRFSDDKVVEYWF